MKITASQSELKTAINFVKGAIESRPSHPVLGNVLCEVKDSELILSGFDLNLLLQTTIGVSVQSEGAVTIPAKLFGDIISALPDGEVIISVDNSNDKHSITISTGESSFLINGISSSEYPELPTISKDNQLSLSSDCLKKGIKDTIMSTSTDDTKQILTGINIAINKNEIKFAATDGHRLSVSKQSIDFDSDTELELTIPAQSLKLLSNHLSDEVLFFVEKNQIQFENNNITILGRLLDGTYPAYSGLIPVKFSQKFVTKRNDLIKAVELVSLLSSSKNNIVCLDILSNEQRLLISVDEKEVGNAKQHLKADIDGSNISLGINGKYLLEGLKSMNSDEIVVSSNSPTSPIVITPLGESEQLYLLMPVQLRD